MARSARSNWGLSDVPDCPGCGRKLSLSQPDVNVPDRLVGACPNEGCRQIVIIGQLEGRWRILSRMPATAAAS